MIEIHPQAGIHITTFAKALVNAAAEHGAAKGTFNGVEIVADRAATCESLCAEWDQKREAAAVAYRNSPEGKAAAAKREAEVQTRQERHDALMRDLATLDFANDVAMLDWLCAIQDSTDDVSVLVNKPVILAEFSRAGFKSGANCGDEFNPDDRENVFRYIVGQALDGLESVGAIHGIIHKFAADWKAMFLAPSQQQGDPGPPISRR